MNTLKGTWALIEEAVPPYLLGSCILILVYHLLVWWVSETEAIAAIGGSVPGALIYLFGDWAGIAYGVCVTLMYWSAIGCVVAHSIKRRRNKI